MIITDRVSAGYGETLVVDDVSVRVPPGGVTALVGPNGAGKSTLLGVIARLLDARGGTVTVDGLDVASTPSDVLARRLAILKQDNRPGLRLTVRDLVGFGRYPHSRGRLTEVDRVHIEDALARLDLQGIADRFLDELSGGQRQRAFVAMVLAQDTDYVLLDEPLNNLDPAHAVAMMRLMRQAADELGRAIVVVVHDLNAAAAYADTMVVMAEGRVRAAGPTRELMNEELLTDVFGVPMRIHEIEGVPHAFYY